MSTVRIALRGEAVILTADPDYTPADWDAAVHELIKKGFVPFDTDPVYVEDDGTEKHVWHRSTLQGEEDAVLLGRSLGYRPLVEAFYDGDGR